MIGAVRTTITAYQCDTCTTLESVLLDLISEAVVVLDVTMWGGGVVYVPLCIQMTEQSELKSMHVNMVHVQL